MTRVHLFWGSWSVAALAALVVAGFFLAGLGDGSVSDFNIGLWLGLLATVALVMLGSLLLHRTGRTVAGFLLSLVLALPALAAVFLILVVIITKPRWN